MISRARVVENMVRSMIRIPEVRSESVAIPLFGGLLRGCSDYGDAGQW
jgi:hypothetical protein